ncbi:hypothetical protein HDV01_003608 [Terramyces sp. JEL0728]|nr:hypothetical protein HDV01_003608 [Terramyces sp. JEL0728]
MKLTCAVDIQSYDLYELEDKNKAAVLSKKLEKYWTGEITLLKVLFDSVFLTAIALSLYVFPELLQDAVEYLSPHGNSLFKNGYVLAVVLFLAQLIVSLLQAFSQNTTRRITLVLKSILSSALYQKLFSISLDAKQQFPDGQIINMLNTDINTIATVVDFTDLVWTIPLRLGIAVYLLISLLGYKSLISFALVIFSVWLTFTTAKYIKQYIRDRIKATDGRITIVREMLMGMQIVKYRGMEEWFAERIQSYRQAELAGIKKFSILTLIIQSIAGVIPPLLPVVVFAVFLATGGYLDPTIVLPSIYLFQNLKDPVNDCTQVIYMWANLKIAWERIKKFIGADENDKDSTIEQLDFIGSDNAVELNEAVFAHMKSKDQKEPFRVGPVTMNIKKGELVVVVGAVGSGKSSFLGALTRQMQLESGTGKVFGKIGYCLQTPWLISGTIKDNIEFYKQADDQKLTEIIGATCLENDLESFPKGIDTQLGDSGVNLSGGQKARVALARALYSDADIYLLDDPIAALDANVGARVFHGAVKKYLAGKTVVVLTHQLQLLHHADKVIHIDNGEIIGQGSFNGLMSSSARFAELVKEYKTSDEESEASETTVIQKPAEKSKKEGKDIIAAEDRAVGVVKSHIYMYYAKSVGWTSLFTLFCTLSTITAGVASLVYLVDSSNDATLPSGFIAIFTGLGLAQAAAYACMFGSIVYGCFQASKKVHANVIACLLAAPMYFYDSQPVGRILNRVNSDISALDAGIVQSLIRIILNFSNVAINSVLILQASWWVIIAVAIVLGLCIILFSKYQNSNREVKRIVSVLKSPLDAHVSESIRGIQTIKCYQIKQEFVNKHWKAIDDYLVSSFILDSIMMWFNLRVSLLTCLLTLALMLIGVVSQNINPDNQYITTAIGLALTAALNFSSSMFKFLLACGIWENQLNSIERLRHYELGLPKEAPRNTPNDPKEEWPSNGKIEFNNVVLQYASRPDHNVLDSLSFVINGGENIGVVGRTGSGKSSMVSALFRLVELHSGSIVIDGIDIKKLGLESLRKSMQIIPQDPVLFTGTIRENLDEELKATDERIWTALDSVGLKGFISNLSGKLDFKVTQKGDNFSQGQKQLLCLARAIITSPKILVLDEATSSVDSAADQLVQNVLKTQFRESTIISVAHRLGTIADFDKVIILDSGVLKEFDSPGNLLRNQESLFYQLVEASGTANASMIKNIVFSD